MDNPLIENFFKPKHLSSLVSSPGQFLGNEEWGPIPPRNTGREGIKEVKCTNKRSNVVRLLPNGFQERKLRRLANISTKLFNEVNYERRQQFFHGGRVDFEGTWDKCYEKYKEELGVNAQAVMQKNNEAWNSLFSLLKLRRENCLLTWIVFRRQVIGRMSLGGS